MKIPIKKQSISKKNKNTLNELVNKIAKKNLHKEISTGLAVGNET